MSLAELDDWASGHSALEEAACCACGSLCPRRSPSVLTIDGWYCELCADERQDCYHCDGTGLGRYSDSRCHWCGGSGASRTPREQAGIDNLD